jgi:cellulose synthase operon protein C
LLRAWLRWLKATDSRWLLPWVVQRFEAALRADDDGWGEASYVLSSLDEHRAVARWMRDWAQRDRPPLYAMGNLAGSLAVLRRWPELRAVVEATLRRAPYHEDMRLWELMLLARQADAAGLAAALERCHEWQPDAWMKPVLVAFQAYRDLALGRPDASRTLRQALPTAKPTQALAIGAELRRLARQRYTPWYLRWRWGWGR